MRLKLFLLLALFATLPLLAQHTGVQGTVVDAKSGLPVVGATVMLDNQGNAATTDALGMFLIDDAMQGADELLEGRQQGEEQREKTRGRRLKAARLRKGYRWVD